LARRTWALAQAVSGSPGAQGAATDVSALRVGSDRSWRSQEHSTNPANPLTATVSKDLQAVADTLGVRLHVLQASTEADFEAAFATAAQSRAAALVIEGSDPWFASHAAQLGALALQHSVPAIYQFREFAAAGGLMSYGGSITDTYRLAGVYAGRILKGEKPADLPVQQATKVELYINMKIARALGVAIPLPLSGRADEIFE
jgi:putative tryptophan/tyrosine transport system substrate-binding protein